MAKQLLFEDRARLKLQRGVKTLADAVGVTMGPTGRNVIAVGPGRLLDSGERVAVSVKVGDQVLFGKYGGTDIEVEGEEVKILRESDILAKIE